MNILSILLDAAPVAQSGAKSGAAQQILMIVVILAIFYFFMIRPQMKRNKEQKKFRDGLEKGQKVVTIGGIHGKIVEVQDATVIIQVEEGVKLKMEKSAIASSVADQLPDQK